MIKKKILKKYNALHYHIFCSYIDRFKAQICHACKKYFRKLQSLISQSLLTGTSFQSEFHDNYTENASDIVFKNHQTLLSLTAHFLLFRIPNIFCFPKKFSSKDCGLILCRCNSIALVIKQDGKHIITKLLDKNLALQS